MRALSPGRGLLTVCLALVLGITAAPLAAQILYGSIVGVVKDTSGAEMPGAPITIVNRDTNLTRETTADAQGHYSLVNGLPGPSDVKVSLQGFRDYIRSGVPVTIGHRGDPDRRWRSRMRCRSNCGTSPPRPAKSA